MGTAARPCGLGDAAQVIRVKAKKRFEAINERIGRLEAAHVSLKGQVAQAVGHEQKQAWQEAVDSIEEELNSLRKSVHDALEEQKLGGEQKSFLQKLEVGLEDAERVVFKAFVLGTTILGAGTILSHEAGRIERPATVIEQKAPSTRQQELEDGGTEPIPEKMRKEQEKRSAEVDRRRKEVQEMIEGLTAGLGPHETAVEWLRLEKICEPNSVSGFLTEVRKIRTLDLPPAPPKES